MSGNKWVLTTSYRAQLSSFEVYKPQVQTNRSSSAWALSIDNGRSHCASALLNPFCVKLYVSVVNCFNTTDAWFYLPRLKCVVLLFTAKVSASYNRTFWLSLKLLPWRPTHSLLFVLTVFLWRLDAHFCCWLFCCFLFTLPPFISAQWACVSLCLSFPFVFPFVNDCNCQTHKHLCIFF